MAFAMAIVELAARFRLLPIPLVRPSTGLTLAEIVLNRPVALVTTPATEAVMVLR